MNATHKQNTSTGHMNSRAALALRARVNLYLDDLNIGGTADHNALALNDAKKIIEDGPYSLYKFDVYAAAW